MRRNLWDTRIQILRRKNIRNLEGKIALVTGAGRGVGAALAKKLAAAGASVVVNDLDEAPAEDTVHEIVQNKGNALSLCGSVTEKEFGETAVEFILDNYGGLDIIVNNAGYIWNSSISKTSDEQWDAMISCHATAPFRILRAASNFIKTAALREESEGNLFHRKVVNVSSIAGFYGGATQIGYSAGKAAMIGITKTLAKEWARYRVNVNCVGFGLIDTRLTGVWEQNVPTSIEIGNRSHKVGFEQNTRKQLEEIIPLRRPGTVEEAAGALYLFCLPESDYITGEIITAGGGLLSY